MEFSGQAMAREKFLTAVERLGELGFDGVHGEAELFGDFAVGAVFKFAEDEDFAAARRQLRDCHREQGGLLLAAGGLGGTRPVVEDARLVHFRYRKGVGRSAAAEEVAGGVAGGGEKEAAWMLDRAAFMRAEKPGVGFLHEIVDVGGADEPVEVGAEGRLVGRELSGEPLRRVGRGRSHGADVWAVGGRSKPVFWRGMMEGASEFLAAPGVSGWAVRSARGSASHATIFDPPPAERPAHLGRLLHESEMRPVPEVTETRGEGGTANLR